MQQILRSVMPKSAMLPWHENTKELWNLIAVLVNRLENKVEIAYQELEAVRKQTILTMAFNHNSSSFMLNTRNK